VKETLVLVMVFVDVVVTGFGRMVLIFFAVPLGTVTVEKGPTVATSVEVVVIVWVTVGVVRMLSVIVGVYISVTGVPTVK
jgi:hypothetical protein